MVLAAAPILVPAPCDNLREARGHCQGQTGLHHFQWQPREAGSLSSTGARLSYQG
jgi:hypothetical protein